MILVTLIIIAITLAIMYLATILTDAWLKSWWALAVSFILEYLIVYYVLSIYIEIILW